MFLLFPFLHSNVTDNNCHKQKWHVLFFTRIKLVPRVPACANAMMTLGRTRTAEQN